MRTSHAAAAAGFLALAGIVAVGAASAQTPAPAGPATAAFNQAVQLHDAGKFAEAIPLFTQAITLGFAPVNQARFRLARAYARAGNPQLALGELETMAAAGFANTAALTSPDLESLRSLPRFKAFETRVNANAHPCQAEPKFHAFDFWIGEWDVQPTGSPRGPIGSGAASIVEAQLDGCVIQENWLPQG